MNTHALIVDDDPAIVRVVQSALTSLKHECSDCGSQESAREWLSKQAFNYVLLDMEIPEQDSRGIPRIQNGINLLEEIVDAYPQLPVIVMTAHGQHNPRLAVEVLTSGAADWINKPFPSPAEGRTLDQVIKRVLAKRGKKVPDLPQSFKGGELVFHPEQVTLCGIRIAGQSDATLARRVLELLSEFNSLGKTYSWSGDDLARRLGCEGGQNSVSSAIGQFRKQAALAFQRENGVQLGEEAIVETSDGGYRLHSLIRVGITERVEDQNSVLPVSRPAGRTPKARRAWIVDQLRAKRRMQLAEMVRACQCSERTVLRYLAQLKESRQVTYEGTPRDGYYCLVSIGADK